VSKLVADLEAESVVELVADPDDGRGKLVKFTPAGVEAIRHGLSVLAGVERDLARVVGDEAMEAMGRTLAALVTETRKRRSRRPCVGVKEGQRTLCNCGAWRRWNAV
jgi:DNA-binding MarR family transcriptional regulator